MLHNNDRHIGHILDTLQALGLAERTDIFVVSDHGFSRVTFAVNVVQELVEAGLMTSLDSDDVVLASSDQAVLLHVRDHAPERIRPLVEWLQAQEWTGVIFTRGARATDGRGPATSPDPQGWVDGTFSLRVDPPGERGAVPDIVTPTWTLARNAMGWQGQTWCIPCGHGRRSGDASHGSMSVDHPQHLRLRGRFRAASRSVSASNIDLVATILALKAFH
jgi:arylsulfatase A-like enzyme